MHCLEFRWSGWMKDGIRQEEMNSTHQSAGGKFGIFTERHQIFASFIRNDVYFDSNCTFYVKFGPVTVIFEM